MLSDLLTRWWQTVPTALLLARFVVVPFSFIIHELAHGLAASLLGDPTPRESGRLAGNPLRHVEPLGWITGLLAGFGWSRPVPIRPHRMRVPARPGGLLAVLAGPLASLSLIVAGRALLDAVFGGPGAPWHGWPTLADLLTVLVRFNLTLLLLNALPLFPLDAYQAIHFLLPLRAAAWWERASGWTTALLGIATASLLILPGSVLQALLGPPVRRALLVFLGW